jgi:pilus assembly protein CpaB
MRNTRALLMIGISILAALAAVWVAARWVAREATMNTSKVVVAAQDIPIGTQLTSQMLRVTDWPAASIPAGSVQDENRLVERVVLTAIHKDEPVLLAKLAPEGARAGLSSIVSKGKRAITVKVNEVVGVAGFALPGNFVDVMVNTQEDGKRQSDRDNTLSKIVLERILVLAVAQETNTDANKPRVVSAVTLEVTPEEAERLDLARSVGSLSLVLRNQVDPDPVKTAGATKAKLLTGLAEAPPPPAAVKADVQPVKAAAPAKVVRKPAPPPASPPASQVAEAPRCVTVITGTKSSSECFQAP